MNEKNMALIILIIISLAQVQIVNAQIVSGPDIVLSSEVGADSYWSMQQQGFDEAQEVVLSEDLQVDGGVIPAGAVVNSHMIFLNKPLIAVELAYGEFNLGQVWEFDGVILGVMSDYKGELELASTPFLGARGFLYPSSPTNGRGLERSIDGYDSLDSYSVSETRLLIAMMVTQSGDWVRVITDANTKKVTVCRVPLDDTKKAKEVTISKNAVASYIAEHDLSFIGVCN